VASAEKLTLPPALANAELPEELGVLDPAVDDAATDVEALVMDGPFAENWNRPPGFGVTGVLIAKGIETTLLATGVVVVTEFFPAGI